MRLFHFSEDGGIARFEPRASAHTEGPVVWAVGEDRAANYLLPRECPRVCVRAGAGDTLHGTPSWFPRLRGGRLLTMRATESAEVHEWLAARAAETSEFREALMLSLSKHEGRAPEAIIAVEAGWMERIRTGSLYRYEMPAAPFRLVDAGAGYWVADESVTPLGMTRIDDLPCAIAAAGAALVAMESLWAFHDAVKASGLTFSMIRMQNAPRLSRPIP